MTKGKLTGQYITGVLAKREAVSHGYDEAILLDVDGYVSEGSGENVFIIRYGEIITTPLTSILGGITRRTVIQHLESQGHRVKEQRFTRDTLICADEVFMCVEQLRKSRLFEKSMDVQLARENPDPFHQNYKKST